MSDDLKNRIIESMDWMVTDMTYRADDLRNNTEEGSQGGYSPELQKSIDLLEELKNG